MEKERDTSLEAARARIHARTTTSLERLNGYWTKIRDPGMREGLRQAVLESSRLHPDECDLI